MKRTASSLLVPLCLSTLVLGTVHCDGGETPPQTPPVPTGEATAEEAAAFMKEADERLRTDWVAMEQAGWTYKTDVTDEHETAMAKAEEQAMGTLTELTKESRRFDDVEGIDAETARQLHLLKVSLPLSAPDDEEKRAELAAISSKIAGMYAKGEHCKDGECRDLEELSEVMATSRDYDELLEAWAGWRTASVQMREPYQRFAVLGNEGAQAFGFSDLGEQWRAGYDMTPAELEAEADRLWEQVKPMYDQLHCLFRARLVEEQGADKVDPAGMIPAHLTGNMWAQDWVHLYPLLEPFPGEPSIEFTDELVAQGYDETKMVKTAESFFVSLGLDPLPATFWERSMFTKPADREVECHASAWDVGYNDDLRIKMCIRIDSEDFRVIHHELGHNYYYHYYYKLPMLHQFGAHDGFHEAVGDTLALSITPAYLHELGLLDEVSVKHEAVINQQLMTALDKIAFLPFGRMIDQWRWDVFSGKIAPEDYNAGWWALREKYQGVTAPVARTEADFDPGAKYHIPANTPYLRYFLATVLQFQFHAALCEAAGHEGPLNECSIYGSEEAGTKLQAMLEMGRAKPWPDALEAVTGSREMDAAPLVAYFEPLTKWLEEQNEGRTCGW